MQSNTNAANYNPVQQLSNESGLVVGLKPQSLKPTYFQQMHDQSLAAVVSTIEHLTTESMFASGWILVLAPVHQLTKQLLEQCQISTQRILLISQRQISNFDNLMRDALTCSTCSAVVSFLPSDSELLDDYEYLATKYQTPLINHGVIAQNNVEQERPLAKVATH